MATAYHNKGTCSLGLEKYWDNLEAFTAAIKIEQNYVDIYINKGTKNSIILLKLNMIIHMDILIKA